MSDLTRLTIAAARQKLKAREISGHASACSGLMANLAVMKIKELS